MERLVGTVPACISVAHTSATPHAIVYTLALAIHSLSLLSCSTSSEHQVHNTISAEQFPVLIIAFSSTVHGHSAGPQSNLPNPLTTDEMKRSNTVLPHMHMKFAGSYTGNSCSTSQPANSGSRSFAAHPCFSKNVSLTNPRAHHNCRTGLLQLRNHDMARSTRNGYATKHVVCGPHQPG